MTEWKNRIIKLNQDGVEFGNVRAALLDYLMYRWENDLFTETELQGKKHEEYISEVLQLKSTLPPHALHQLAKEVRRLKKEHDAQSVEAGQGKQDTTGEVLSVYTSTVANDPAVPQFFVPPAPPAAPPVHRNPMENMKVTSVTEATLLAKIGLFIAFLQTGMNEEWGLNIMRLAGYDPLKIYEQLNRIRQGDR